MLVITRGYSKLLLGLQLCLPSSMGKNHLGLVGLCRAVGQVLMGSDRKFATLRNASQRPPEVLEMAHGRWQWVTLKRLGMPEKSIERWKYRKVLIHREIRGCPVLRGAHFQHSKSSLWKKSELTIALVHLGANTRSRRMS